MQGCQLNLYASSHYNQNLSPEKIIKNRTLPTPSIEDLDAFTLDDNGSDSSYPTSQKSIKSEKGILVIHYIDDKLRELF